MPGRLCPFHLWSFALLQVLLASAALAQSGFDAHGFRLAAHDGDLRDPLALQRPGAFVAGDTWFASVFDYADAPLVAIRTPTTGGKSREVAVVDDMVTANLSFGAAAHERLRFDLSMPYTFVARGQREIGPGDAAFGDMRLGGMVMLLRPIHRQGGGGAGLGIYPWLDLPTGRPSLLLGQGGVAGGASMALTIESEIVTFTTDVGVGLRPDATGLSNVTSGDYADLGAALGVVVGPTTGLVAEANTDLAFQTSKISGTAVPTEGILSLRQHADEHVHFTFGGAAGLTPGVGSAAWRAFFGIGWRTITPARAPDRDPVHHFVVHDRCPAEPEVRNDWQDDDGCPDTLAAMQVRALWEGRPIGGAQLTITGPEGSQQTVSTITSLSFDAVPGSQWTASASMPSACLGGQAAVTAADGPTDLTVHLTPVTEARVRVEAQTPDGELPDGAIVTMLSAQPACVPVVAQAFRGVGLYHVGRGTHTVLVNVPGYAVHQEEVTVAPAQEVLVTVALQPTAVRITAQRIEIAEKVHFETGKAIIKTDSFGLLNEVAKVILAHPEAGRIEVAGHTDSRGGEALNQRLSQERAAAVEAFLVSAGVTPERLLSRGYGEVEPIDTNKTESGRAANRRVEFRLVDRADDAEGAQ